MHLSILVLASTLLTTPQQIKTEIRGSIEASLVRSHRDAGQALAAQVARLLGWQGDVARQVHPKDSLDLLFEPGAEPQLLALAYRGQKIEMQAFRFSGHDAVPRFFDAQGKMIEPFLKNNPVPKYVQITEVPQRGRGKRFHNGLDLKAPTGTPIVAPYDGKISRVNWRKRYNGNCVDVIFHKKGIHALFLHLDKVASGIKAGKRIKAGTRIGTVGSTGRSGAPHLHYELRDKRGRVLNPLDYHGTKPLILSHDKMKAYQKVVQRYQKLLR